MGQPPRSAPASDGTRSRRSGGFRRAEAGTSARPLSARSIASRPPTATTFAMLSGVSLTNEKSYLIGKFAPPQVAHRNLDYNGRFCTVSAGVGNKKALGADRAPNPCSDIPLADVVWVAGSNVAETFPITTSYIWRARSRSPHRAGPPGGAPGTHRRPVPPSSPRERLRFPSAPCSTN